MATFQLRCRIVKLGEAQFIASVVARPGRHEGEEQSESTFAATRELAELSCDMLLQEMRRRLESDGHVVTLLRAEEPR